MKHEWENCNRIYDVKLVMNYNNGRLGVAREVSDIPDGVVDMMTTYMYFVKSVVAIWIIKNLAMD